LIEKEELQTIIPHKGKMFLLSRVIEYDLAHGIRAEYDITGNGREIDEEYIMSNNFAFGEVNTSLIFRNLP